ncbi:hypothetical protein [Nostoc sp. C117]|uniref:hypothetical protein n=1 Tax=Nostoc sp. C117 TaxID=3349875 RepID=UPI00370D87CB
MLTVNSRRLSTLLYETLGESYGASKRAIALLLLILFGRIPHHKIEWLWRGN